LVASRLKGNKGLTLIELLLAMAISAVLTAAVYRTFIGQHRTYAVQEQVVDMQQNARVAINRMMREIRMAGFGNVSVVLPDFTAKDGPFNNIINPSNNTNTVGQNDDRITIIGAFEQVSTLATDHTIGGNTLQLGGKASEFDLANRKYVCVAGLETHTVINISDNTLTLSGNLINKYAEGAPVFKVKAVTYRLRWDNSSPNMPVLTREDNTDGGGSQVIAEGIENLQFRYVLNDKSESDSPADPSKIRMVRVTINARTRISDPELKGEPGGFRRRTIASNILVRNMMFGP
jgi:type IV pilus assembly protein PilW